MEYLTFLCSTFLNFPKICQFSAEKSCVTLEIDMCVVLLFGCWNYLTATRSCIWKWIFYPHLYPKECWFISYLPKEKFKLLKSNCYQKLSNHSPLPLGTKSVLQSCSNINFCTLAISLYITCYRDSIASYILRGALKCFTFPDKNGKKENEKVDEHLISSDRLNILCQIVCNRIVPNKIAPFEL